MIYTSYVANLRNIPDNVAKASISVSPPDFVKDKFYSEGKNYLWMQDVAPKWSDVKDYKDAKIDQKEFAMRYFKLLDSRFPYPEMLTTLINVYKGTFRKDIVLYCYERPEDFCHRHLLTAYLKKKCGVACEEWNNGIE